MSNTTANRTALVVTGMHRSGTSALTRILHLACGADLPTDLMPPRPDNVAGFWEPLGVIEVHDAMLEAFGSTWHDIDPPKRFWESLELIGLHKNSIKKSLEYSFAASSFFVVKDCRISRFTPLTLDILRELGAEPKFVIALRNPIEVAASLKKRDGFPIPKSLLLWLDYNLAVERYTRNCSRVFCQYDELLDDWYRTVEAVCKTLGVYIPAKSDISPEPEKFIDRRLRHHDYSLDYVEDTAIDWVSEAYKALRLLASGVQGEGVQKRLDQIHTKFNACRESIRSNIQYGHDLEIARLRNQLKNRDNELKHLEDVLQQREDVLQQREDVVKQRNEQIVELSASLRAKEADLKSLIKERRHAKRTRAKLKSELAAVYASSSWRFTAPARSLRLLGPGMFSGLRGLPRNKSTSANSRERLEPKSQPQNVTAAKIVSRTSTSPIKIGKLAIQTATHPFVSIIIPVYENHLFTFNCLASLAKHTDLSSCEIIVVDDHSPTPVIEALSGVDGITIIRNEKNLGFLSSCHAGANGAKGEYLVFLNNDIEATDGWLAGLLNTFSLREDAGLVGARLIYPDGRLQEAGGIVWRDGSACNWGRDQDPDHPDYNYLREVDYCSGACLIIKRDDWLALGGFDKAFEPAYYEDTDLAFRVRTLGKRVYYQPECTIIHHEGKSHGTDESHGIKRFQALNKTKFFERWKETLRAHQPNGVQPEREADRNAPFRVLFVDVMLTPDQDSGSVRATAMLELLVKLGCKVDFVARNLLERDLEYPKRYKSWLQQIGVEVWYKPYLMNIEDLLKRNGASYDFVFLCRDAALRYLAQVKARAPQAKVIYDTVDLNYLRREREAEIRGSLSLKAAAQETKVEELRVVCSSDVTIVVSEFEREQLRKEVPDAQVEIVSNIHVLHEPATSFEHTHGLLFVGCFEHQPNVDAINWFLEEVWPHLRDKLPEISLDVLGSRMPDAMKSTAVPGVNMHGYVENLQPFLGSARISIAPLRYGAGVKGKINEAMAWGIPVVATPMAVEGMHLTQGSDVLIANDAEEFAASIAKLYNDEVLWLRLREGGRENLRRHFSRERAEVILRRLLEHKGVSVVNGRSPREVLSSAYESEYECVWNRSAKLSRSSAYTDLAEEAVDAACDVKFIAYYLPQYHPIHENDVWWGKGFTDWRNVTRAMPIYAGHYQPRLPGELGYYDLRLVETIRRQAELARLYGISAFCFHFYWFGGKRLLETPLLNFLKRKDIDLSFCLCWANENWTRRWDGRSDEVLIGQSHSPQDDLSFIEYLSKFFEDPRYLKVNDKPVLIVYRPALFPEITRTIERWRSAANKAGISGLHIVATNAFVFKDAASSGFDAIAEFPPHGVKAGLWSAPILAPEFSGKIFSYPEVVESATNSDTVSRVPIWPGAMPGWDNTPRMPQRGHLFHGSTPEFFETWLSDCIRRTRHNPASERFVMINAWNEWAEGAYLEPDQYYGYAYLAACAGALKRAVKANVTVNLNTVNQGQRLDTAGMPAS